MTVGCAGGVLLALFVLGGGTAKAGAERVEFDQLTTWSYIVLSVMLAIIVVGLGWCFYRAVRAAGGAAADVQVAEGAENSQ